MKANETGLLKFLQGTRQFIIPIYQRTYSWTLAECQQLWSDIIRASENDNISAHFIGSVVYIERGLYQVSAVPQVLVIDGQQRLTTLTLLLAALGKILEERGLTGEVTRKKIGAYCLFNSEEEGELRYKLLLTRSDKETLIRILDDVDPLKTASRRITDNYAFFLQQLRRPDVDPLRIYQGVSKLILVDISLDRTHDNPQLIFESLNSTGRELSQVDLIRNYVLMGQDVAEQTQLYNHYWYPMEQRLMEQPASHDEAIPLFDRFMRDYLTIQSPSGAIPNVKDVYTAFKTYRIQHEAATIADIVADIYRHARHFIKLVYAEDEDKQIAAVIADINALKVDVAYPFLLGLYGDYSSARLSHDDFLAILRLVESYVFRRSICGIPTNSLNKTFAQFMRGVDRDHYRESVEAAFLGLESYRRFPRDTEFTAAFVMKDIYNLRVRNYLLRKLENSAHSKEPEVVEKYTIEHVLPQNKNLNVAWRAELGPEWQQVQATYLHTIGNLTLTGYNPELSDHSFIEKRTTMPGGFDTSPLYLNSSIAHQEHWGPEQITQRAQLLAGQAVAIWAAPTLSAEAVARQARVGETEDTRSYARADTNYAAYLQGDMLALFEQLRKRILNIDASVREEIKRYYIAYKTVTNFVDIEPQRQRLRLTLNMRFDEIVDPLNVCRDITNVGRWGNGDVETTIASVADLDNVMFLIEQAFEKQREDAA
ncbi:MAG: DUF262 and DUF1524 domain-containing protein [Ktedonobacterales bacterium]